MSHPPDTVADPLVAALRGLDACAVSDALDTLGLRGATTDLRPLWPAAGVVAGRVRTIQAGPKTADGPGQHIATPLVVTAQPGDVIVIANDGRLDVSCWGGILTVAALQRGVAAVVVDGACRDIEESQTLGLPVYGRAVVPVSARGRIVQTAMDVEVSVAGISVRTDDYAIADASGVVFVDAVEAKRVVELAQRIAAREQTMVEAVQSGRSIEDVMHDSKFPTLEEAS